MVRHITLWKLKDFACGNDKETNFEISKKMSYDQLGKFDGLISVEVGKGIKVGGANYDIGKIFTFRDREALETYLATPMHQEVHNFNKEIRYERAVIDYEIED